jgi:hypothetical protein
MRKEQHKPKAHSAEHRLQRIAAIPPRLVMVGRPVTVFRGVEWKWAEAEGYINKQYELLNSYLFTSFR